MTRSGANTASNRTRGYTVELREEEDGSWSAKVPELPGSVAVGDTPNDAIGDLPAVIDLWVAVARERGLAIPPPRLEPEVSGRVLLRLTKDLHRALGNRARIEGVSLNTYIVSALSVAVGESIARRARVAPAASYEDVLTAFRGTYLSANAVIVSRARTQTDLISALTSTDVPSLTGIVRTTGVEINTFDLKGTLPEGASAWGSVRVVDA